MKTIVAGYDGSEQGERVLARAAELAQPLDAKLVVVSVGRLPGLTDIESMFDPNLAPAPLVPAGTGGPLPPAVPPAPAAPQGPPEEQLLLERARGFLAPRRIEVEYVAETGDPAERLLQVAGERDADLIVVGRGEHRLLERLLGRAVDERLARHADRDLMLVR